MATTLYGWTWVGDDEPTEGVKAGQTWFKPTTGNNYQRNTSNTAWTFMGNANSRLSGAVEVAGSTMTGPLLDAPNLPPLDDPDFTGTIRQGGSPVALETSLASLEKRLYDRIGYLVRQQFLSNTKRSGTAANIAFESGVEALTLHAARDTGFTIPLPVFQSDGITATDDQILGYIYGIAGFEYYLDSIGGYDGSIKYKLVEYTPGSRVVNLYAHPSGVPLVWDLLERGGIDKVHISYAILAVR